MAEPPPSIVCSFADVQGKVKFGKGCIIHPGCSIVADAGEIIFGDYNIVEERVVIFNKAVKDKNGQIVPTTLKIGSYNLFEVGSMIEYSEIGDCNTFNPKSTCSRTTFMIVGHLEYGCRIKNGCTIGAFVKVPMSTALDLAKNQLHLENVIEDYMAVCHPGKLVRNFNFNEEVHKQSIQSLCQALEKQLPQFNQLKSGGGPPARPSESQRESTPKLSEKDQGAPKPSPT